MKLNLSDYWELFSIPEPVEEYVFHKGRKFRFDYCWPKYMIALEKEGGTFTYGRHSRPMGYRKDLEKYNQAAFDGWTVFRFTPEDFRNGKAGTFLENYFSSVVFKNGNKKNQQGGET
jgi:hypothetical protein